MYDSDVRLLAMLSEITNLRSHRWAGLQMVLRLLAFNAEVWLAEH